MTTATPTFARATHVYRSETGCYEFAGEGSQSFASATHDESDGKPLAWETLERLLGWGEWTHAIRVFTWDRDMFYFVR